MLSIFICKANNPLGHSVVTSVLASIMYISVSPRTAKRFLNMVFPLGPLGDTVEQYLCQLDSPELPGFLCFGATVV